LHSGSLAGCEDQPCSWVCREGKKNEEREGYATKCVDRTICFHLIYQEKQLCGRIPRERVNHINLGILCG
jgi:hypothetical protein